MRGRAGVEGDNITIPGIEQRFSAYRDRDRPTTSSGAAPAATSEITVFSHLFFFHHTLLSIYLLTIMTDITDGLISPKPRDVLARKRDLFSPSPFPLFFSALSRVTLRFRRLLW